MKKYKLFITLAASLFLTPVGYTHNPGTTAKG